MDLFKSSGVVIPAYCYMAECACCLRTVSRNLSSMDKFIKLFMVLYFALCDKDAIILRLCIGSQNFEVKHASARIILGQ